MECWPFFRAIQRTVLKLSEFKEHEGHWSGLTPSDKWIGNKLPNSRDGPLILIKADVKRRSEPHENVNSSVGVNRGSHAATHIYTYITTSRMPLCTTGHWQPHWHHSALFLHPWLMLPPHHHWHRHPPSPLNSLPCPISWAWLETKRQALGTEWPGQPEI